MNTYKELMKEIHQNAKDKGFWDKERNFGEMIALMQSEVAEALESHRKGEEPLFFVGDKPEGVITELADCFIRILDTLGSYPEYVVTEGFWDVPVHIEYFDNFGEALANINVSLSFSYYYRDDELPKLACLRKAALTCVSVSDYFYTSGSFLDIVRMKMDYNKTRERLHGKKY